MKLLFLLLYSFLSAEAFSASCCVSNTSVSNLMILPSKWQETVTLSQTRVIGDTNDKGQSTFRKGTNKEWTNLARLDLAYGWTSRYQSGVAVKYQNKTREFNGESSNDSGWNDIGLSQAYRPFEFERIWIFQTLNIPTAKSTYDSRENFAIDARGTGTYLTSLGVFGIHNVKEWDFIYSGESHYSFARTFENNQTTTEVGSFWGGSVTAGAGFIPWKSKARYGAALTPRLEGAKDVTVGDSQSKGRQSLVWDSSVNFTYTFNADYSLGLNYVDQTLFGPARNTLLNRSFSFLFQTRWL